MIRGILLALVLAACGCGSGRVRAPAMVVRAPSGLRSDVFATLLVRAEARGYQVRYVDPELGRFVVVSRAFPSSRYLFEVQCYADARVRVSIDGLAEYAHSGTIIVPAELRRELVLLSQSLGEIAEPSPSRIPSAQSVEIRSDR